MKCQELDKQSREQRFSVPPFPPQDLRQYLSSLAEQCNSAETVTELPAVVILDNLHHIGSLSDIFNGFLNCKYHKWWVPPTYVHVLPFSETNSRFLLLLPPSARMSSGP